MRSRLHTDNCLTGRTSTLPTSVGLVRRIECVPYAAWSSPIDSTKDPTIREYCRVDRDASRVCSVISNCTGRCVFFCMTIARAAT